MPPIIPLWLLVVIFAVLWGLHKGEEANRLRKRQLLEEKENERQRIEVADMRREMGPTMDHLAERERGGRD
jgi:flagellar biosynthesis/type III secretory pathway M-ring protein FliF/YscJ